MIIRSFCRFIQENPYKSMCPGLIRSGHTLYCFGSKSYVRAFFFGKNGESKITVSGFASKSSGCSR